MEFRPEYAELEIAINAKVEELGLIDARYLEIFREKHASRSEFMEQFQKSFEGKLRDKPPGIDLT